MANWLDVFSLFFTLGVIGSILLFVYVFMQSAHAAKVAAKESLKAKGYNVSRTGASIKTRQFEQEEDYITATQKQILRALSSMSFGSVGEESNDAHAHKSAAHGGSRSSGGRPIKGHEGKRRD